jgi:hypothetical protein
VGFEHNRGKGFGRDLGVNKKVESMVKRNRIGLLADEAGAVLQTEVTNIVTEQSIHCA